MRLSVRVLVALFAVALTGCGTRDGPAPFLMDGSSAVRPSVDLEGVSDATVMTTVRAANAAEAAGDSAMASCLRGPASDAHPEGQLVARIGVSGESVTLRDAAGLHACDNSQGPREGDGRWCGSAFGRLAAGQLRDSRLDIAGCRAADGEPIGFAWVVPGPRVRYLVVSQPGYSEVYEVAASLPIRISTVSGYRSEPLGATFELSEHDAKGGLLKRYRLETYPAG